MHPAYDEVPERFAELPAVCVIRNPWDWYVSLYHYVHKIAAREPGRVRGHLWSRVMGEGRNSFTQWCDWPAGCARPTAVSRPGYGRCGASMPTTTPPCITCTPAAARGSP